MPTQLYAVSGSPRAGPNLSSMRTELLTQIRTEMHAFHEQLMGQMQSNLAGLTTVLNQEVCELRAEIGNIRAEIQQEIGNIRAELNEVRTFAEKNVRKRPAPLRLSPGLPCTVTEAHRGYHEPTAASVGRSAADRV